MIGRPGPVARARRLAGLVLPAAAALAYLVLEAAPKIRFGP